MADKPTYKELEQRVTTLENDLAAFQEQNGDVLLREQYLKAILDNTNLPIYLKDADFRYILINPEYERLAHITNDQVQGKDDFAVFPEPIAQLFREQDEEVARRKTLVEFTETIQLADGEHTFLTAKFPLIDSEGRVYAIGGVCTDITSLQQTKESLRQSEEKYRKLFTNEIDAISIFDVETRQILDVNDAFLKLYGYTRDEVLQLRADDMSAEPEKTKEAVRKSADGQGDVLIPIRHHKKKDGTVIIVQLSAGPFTWKGKPVMYAIIRDITAQIKAEEALKASEHKFRSILESCPEGIHMYTLQPDGDLIFTGANPAADTILKVDHKQFIGKTIEEAFPGIADTEVPDRYREACTNGKSWQAEQVVYKDEKIEGAYEVHAFQTKPGSMAVFFQDVTGKRRMEEELQKIQKLESVGILAGGIAHDFNNLLTAILGNISMAKLFAQTDQLKVQERLVDAEKATIRARDLTQQLLTFAKGGAPVKSAALIQEVINDSTSFMLSGSNVKCDLEVPEDVWPVDIDVGQISQVIQNLVKNADQAMPEGGTIAIKTANILIDETENSPLRPGRYVHICIADQGIGIPKKHLTKVFDPYFSTKQEGSGLGLAASYSIIKNHDGLITAESEYGSGSTFHIYLPASSKEPAVKVVHREKSVRSGESILIMDDDEDVLNVAVNMLNLMGYKTDTAHDGSEAVTKYSQAIKDGQPFDGVLLDLTIPGGMGGRETVQQLANLDPEVKAIVSSGYANDPILADYATHGFKGVVTKPYDMEQLGQVLRNIFD